jgi:glycine/D-amino acid oxidase-like deaminating enzyme
VTQLGASVERVSPWSAELDGDDRARLRPGVAQNLPRRPDVLVVGGGVVGVAIAVACATAGLGSVLLIEQDSLASGATGGAAGLLIPDAHQGSDPAHFVGLGRSSLALWRQLDAEVPGGVGLADIDWIGLEPHSPGFAADPPPGAERLGAEEIAELIPDLAQPVPAVRLRQGRLNPVLAVARLAGSLPPAATTATGVTAEAVKTRGGRVTSVSTSAGAISPGAVVFATGGPPRLDGLDLQLPSRRVKGHLLAIGPVGIVWPGSVSPLATSIGAGRLLLGGTLDIGDASPDVRPDVIAGIRSSLEAAVPAAAQARSSHAWCCFRPAHPDDLPVVDRIAGLENAWVTSGHFRTGILMAPATGRALATWIATGWAPSEIAELQASRFDAV